MDLVAISPVTRPVALGRARVEVTGLSLRKLTGLAAAYPDLVPLLAGGEVGIAKMLVDGPDAATTIWSLGFVGPARPRRWRLLFWRKPVEPIEDESGLLKAFDMAPFGQQADAIGTIIDLTFKGERAIPFVKAIVAAMARAPEPSIPPEPTPSPSEGSSEPDTPQTTSGE